MRVSIWLEDELYLHLSDSKNEKYNTYGSDVYEFIL